MKGIDVIVEQAGSRYQIAVVRVLGQIDTTTSHELERRLQYLLKDHQFEIIIDLSKVTYISSAGWGIFISEIRGIRESGGDLKLVGMTLEVAEVFQLLEFHNILESFKTIEAAVERFERPKPSTPPEKQKPGESLKIVSDITSTIITNAAGAEAAKASPAESGAATGGKISREAAARVDSEYSATNHARPGVAAASLPGAPMPGSSAPVAAGSPADAAAGTPATGDTGTREKPETEPLSKDLEAMILEIVREHPDYGCLKIRKELLEHDYRRPMNPLSLFMELKRLNLETKEKRKRYSDSLAVAANKR